MMCSQSNQFFPEAKLLIREEKSAEVICSRQFIATFPAE